MRVILFIFAIYFPGVLFSQNIPAYQALSDRGKKMQNLNPDSAFYFHSLGLKLAKEERYTFGKVEALKDLGFDEHLRGHYIESVGLLTKALDMISQVDLTKISASDRIRFQNLLAGVYGNLAIVHGKQNDLPNALKYLFSSLSISEKTKDYGGVIRCYNNIAIIYKLMDLNNKAIEFYEKAIASEKKHRLNVGTDHMYSGIADIYLKEKNFPKAASFYHQAIQDAQLRKDYRSIIISLTGLGDVSFYENKFKEAERYYKRALQLGDSINYQNTYTLLQLSTLYLESNDLQNAERIATQAIEYSNVNDLAYIYEVLSQTKEKKGDLKLSLIYYKRAVQIRDSINSNKNISEAIQQEFKFNYAKKNAVDSITYAKEKRIKDIEIISQRKTLEAKKSLQILMTCCMILLTILGLFIYARYRISQQQKKVIAHQKRLVDEKQKEIVDSINYAKRIQTTLLADNDFLMENLPECFVYFQPKDIVSGDFYWAAKNGSRFYLAVCDSTGHGVPGAFMSLLNIGYLAEAISEKGLIRPNEIFDFVRAKLSASISKDGQRDGFDGILFCIDNYSNTVTYSAANNSPVLIRDGKIIEPSFDKMPVGMGERHAPFSLYTIDIQKGDSFYLYTDGYADQFGGPKGKKFKYKQLNNLLLTISHKSLGDQKKILEDDFNNWKRELEQVDDVCIIGLKF